MEGQRYNSTDEMKAEFGSYRVNGYTDKVCDSNVDKNLESLVTPLEESLNEQNPNSY